MQIYVKEFHYRDFQFVIAATKKGLCFIGSEKSWNVWRNKQLTDEFLEDENGVTDPYCLQLAAYFKGERESFDFPLDLSSTAFQDSVWKALMEIPYGITQSYQDIADKIGRPRAVRAVGTAIGQNPALIIIPCHRVIRKNGTLAGFREGIEMKKKLLKLEAAI